MLRRFCLTACIGIAISIQGLYAQESFSTQEISPIAGYGYGGDYAPYQGGNYGCVESCYALNPPAIPNFPCGWNLLFTADFLYWQVRSDFQDYAQAVTPIPGEVHSQFTERVKPTTRSGVRLGFDYLMPCFDGWDFAVEWTYLHTDASARSTAPVGGVLLAILVENLPSAQLARAEQHFTLNIADFTLGRAFCVGKRLSFRPNAGLRGLWFQNHSDVDYSGGDFGNVDHAKTHVNFKGGGIRAGFDTDWALFCGFSLAARAHFDILWSKFDFDQRGIHRVNEVVRDNRDDSIHAFTPMTEFFLGLVWERMLCCRYYVNAHIGWEQQYIVTGSRASRLSTAIATDSLDPRNAYTVPLVGGCGFGGLTAGFTIGF